MGKCQLLIIQNETVTYGYCEFFIYINYICATGEKRGNLGEQQGILLIKYDTTITVLTYNSLWIPEMGFYNRINKF